MRTSTMNELRLHTVAEPHATTEPSFDIFAVHGPGGVYDRSWRKSNGNSWLWDVLPHKFPSCRIVSIQVPKVFQYLLSTDVDVSNLISDISYDRKQRRRSDTPIIFITHSFSGALVKQLYVTAARKVDDTYENNSMFNCVRGFVWLGVPHRPLTIEDKNGLYRSFQRGAQRSLGGGINCLKDVFDTVNYVNDDFRRLGGEALPACLFYEMQKTSLTRGEVFIVTKDQASYLSYTGKNIKSGSIDRKHTDMTHLGGESDPDCRRVVTAMEDMIRIINSPSFSTSIGPRQESKGINVLSFDGGGVRGLFSLLVLEKLLAEVERRCGNSRQKRLPCEYFDLIGGTSTGGLIAIMLGRLQMDIASCIQSYRLMSKDIFGSSGGIFSVLNPVRHGIQALTGQSWFDGEKLKDAICRIVEQQTHLTEREDLEKAGFSVSDVRFLATDVLKTKCFVCAICEGHHLAERIRSYLPRKRVGKDTSNYTIWEAGRATSAAPMYFPPIQIKGHHYFDGGLHCNNPILEVIDEVRLEFPDTNIDTIVSIGTGKGEVAEPFAPLPNFIASAIGRLTTTESQDDQLRRSPDFAKIESAYFRFQELEKVGKIDLAGANKLDELEELAKGYLNTPEIGRQIANCASRMIQSGRFT